MWQLFRIPISSRIPTLSFSFARVQNFTWPLIMPVGTFGVFKYYFQSRSCFTDFTELLFQKYPENLAIFPMVNLKFTGSTYSLYLCINCLTDKLFFAEDIQFTPYLVMPYLLVFLISKHLICLRNKTISDHPFRKQDYP